MAQHKNTDNCLITLTYNTQSSCNNHRLQNGTSVTIYLEVCHYSNKKVKKRSKNKKAITEKVCISDSLRNGFR